MNDINKCVDDETYSLTKCLKDFIIKEVGCSLNWLKYHGHPTCISKEELFETQKIFKWIQITSFENLTSTTGCFLKCRKLKYEMDIESVKKITWKVQWISEVFIQPSSSSHGKLHFPWTTSFESNICE